jgi:hypothetical protein
MNMIRIFQHNVSIVNLYTVHAHGNHPPRGSYCINTLKYRVCCTNHANNDSHFKARCDEGDMYVK